MHFGHIRASRTFANLVRNGDIGVLERRPPRRVAGGGVFGCLLGFYLNYWTYGCSVLCSRQPVLLALYRVADRGCTLSRCRVMA